MLLSVEEISVHFGQNTYPKADPQKPRWLGFSRKSAKEPISSAAPVLHRLSLSVEQNEFLAILGPSGSGKSTLLRTIAGLIIPDSGQIILNGTDITLEPPHRREVSLVFQNGGWYDHLTVRQHFEFDGLTEDQILQLLHPLGLFEAASRRPAELSGGQAQRLAIGRALARHRSILLLDEPLSQLDQPVRESLRQLLRSIHSQGHTLVYVTHDQTDAMLLASKIAVLHNGMIQQIGPPKELFDAPNHRSVAEMLGQPPMQFFDIQLSISSDRSELVSQAIAHAMLRGITPLVSASRLLVGIRPGAWRIFEQTTPTERYSGSDRISFEAVFVEERFMGHQRLLQFKVAHSAMPNIYTLDDWTNAPKPFVPGKPYQISVSLVDLHWFDAESGNRMPSVSGSHSHSHT
jgi:ABC-type sugar transport system ATPase subunit